MKILNLVNKKESDIKYNIQKFPDGQCDIVILQENYIDKQPQIQSYFPLNNKSIVQIKSRLNNMEDLGMIICATQALRNLRVKEIHLYTPWIMGLRSDRLFQEGGVRYIKDVLAPMINSQNYESVTCYDAHSDVAQNCINNLKIIDNEELVKYALGEIYNFDSGNMDKDFILVSPDSGALKKIYKIADELEFKGDIITCSKSRDNEGKLTKTNLGFIPANLGNKDLIIIDDLIDAGGTFINISKAFKDLGFTNKIYLVISHGIFSKGTKELSKYFDGIYCTNSYRDIKMLDEDYRFNLEGPFVKQLNVF